MVEKKEKQENEFDKDTNSDMRCSGDETPIN
jgi:hypothetical protein